LHQLFGHQFLRIQDQTGSLDEISATRAISNGLAMAGASMWITCSAAMQLRGGLLGAQSATPIAPPQRGERNRQPDADSEGPATAVSALIARRIHGWGTPTGMDRTLTPRRLRGEHSMVQRSSIAGGRRRDAKLPASRAR
jgi:hypothetical protein